LAAQTVAVIEAREAGGAQEEGWDSVGFRSPEKAALEVSVLEIAVLARVEIGAWARGRPDNRV
jgi:hypothetical protein